MKHSSTPFFRFIILFLSILFIWPTLTAGVNIPEDFLKPHILEVGLLDDCDTEDYTAANFSGMDEDAYSFINERAKLLRNVIPDGQRCDFRIFDCATYPVLAMSEGDEANQRGFELLIDQIEQQIGAKYYLTIVRVLHPTSEGSTLMVKLKLPKGDAFPDDDAAQIALETYLKSFIKTELPVSPLPSRLVEFETMLLDSTAAAIDRLLSGVPMLSSSQNRARMEEDGFVFFDLPGFTVLPGVTGADGEQIIENKRSTSNGVFLIDNFSFEGLDGSDIDLHSSFQNQLTEIDDHYYKPRNEFFNGNVIVSNNVGGYSNDRYNTEYQSYLSGEHDFKMWVDIYEHNADTVKMAVLYDQSDSLSSYIYQDHFNAITDQTDEIVCNSNIGFSGIDFRVKNCLYDDPISTAAETAYQLLIQTNGEFPVGLISGFVDGLIEMLDFVLVAFAQSSSLGKDLFNKSIVGISFNFIRNLAITKNFRESAIQSHMTAHKAQQALVKRAKIVFNVLGGLISNFGSVFTAIKNSVIEWLGNLAFKNGIYQAGYTYGKTLFELVLEVGLGIFTGGTANLARNGGKILNRMSKLIENGPEGLASYIGEVAKNKLTHLDINPFSGNNLKRARNLIFGCFVAGTMISTADGGVPIEQIQVGDSVLCYDFVKAQVIEEKVLGKVSLEVQGLIQIKLGDNHIIEATPEHPFMTESGWLEARMLDENNLLLGKQGDWISISSIKKNSTELRRVYNFEVQHCHNYYVGEGAVLVHNVNGLVCTITTIATSWVQIPVVIADNLIRMVSGSISKAAFKKKVDDLLKAESGYDEHSFTDPRDGKTMYFIKKQAAEYDQSKRVFVIGKIDPTSPNGLQGNKLVWGEIDNHVFDEMSNLAPEEFFELIDDMRRTDGTALDIGKLSKGVVRAWDRVRTAAKNVNPNLPDAGKILRTDIPSLTALSKFDDALINSIGQQRFDNFLEKLIKANPKCSTCGNAGDALVGNLDNVLDDFHKVATERAVGPNGGFVQGFDDFMTEAGEQASKAKAAALTLKKMSNNWDELTEGGYTLNRFEGNIPDIETGHKLDLLFEKTNANDITELKSVEMKNWSSAQTVPSSQGTQYYAYINSGNKFDYYFSDGIREAMKTRFQSIYKNSTKATELFDLNPTYFASQNIPNATVLNNLANQGGLVTHPTFMNFVK